MIRCFSAIIGLILLLFGCATTNMVTDLYKINSSTAKIRQIYVKHKNELTPQEQQALRDAWLKWQEIWETLDANGCGLKHVTKDVCKLDVATIQELHDTAKKTYEEIKPMVKAKENKLTIQERITLRQFDQAMRELDKNVTQFLEDPNNENQLLVIKGLSGLAVVGAKVAPMVIGAL